MARDLRKQIEQTKQIVESISTRYVGQFPRSEFLSKIATILDSAKRDIAILCDFPAYGAFASPIVSTKYRQTLEAKSQAGVKIIIAHYDGPGRAKSYKEFFDASPGWEIWKSSHPDMVAEYLRLHGIDGKRELSLEQLLQLLETDNKKIRDIANVKCKDIETHIPLFFWIVDGVEAIFSVPGLPEEFSEYGFTTRDQTLIQAFRTMLDRYTGEITGT